MVSDVELIVCHRCARQGGALKFRITTSTVVMFNQPRKSSDRMMFLNHPIGGCRRILNHGTDHLVIRFDGHVERNAFYFIAAWRMSRTFN